MLESLPPWVQTGAVWAGGAIGTILLTRSAAKKKLSESIAIATTELKDSNRNLMESQTIELAQLRSEVSSLRTSQGALIELNKRYLIAIQEKELQLSELQHDLRMRDARIMSLERRLEVK